MGQTHSQTLPNGQTETINLNGFDKSLVSSGILNRTDQFNQLIQAANNAIVCGPDCQKQQKTDLLVRLPGIGKKTAERLVVEMKDSLMQLPQSLESQNHSEQDEAIRALEALGYKSHEASKAIRSIDDANEKTCEQLIRQALQILASR